MPINRRFVTFFLLLGGVILIVPGKPPVPINANNAVLGVAQTVLGGVGVVAGVASVVGGIAASRAKE